MSILRWHLTLSWYKVETHKTHQIQVCLTAAAPRMSGLSACTSCSASSCGPGQYLRSCNGASAGICTPCPSGSYSNVLGLCSHIYESFCIIAMTFTVTFTFIPFYHELSLYRVFLRTLVRVTTSSRQPWIVVYDAVQKCCYESFLFPPTNF